jgi:hypothetical protein
LTIDTTLDSSVYEHNITAARVTGFTDEDISEWFEIAVSVGCYNETQIVVDPSITPYSETYDFALAFPYKDPSVSNFWAHYDFPADLFKTDIDGCWASQLELFADADLATPYDQPNVLFFSTNPTVKNAASGPPTATLNIDLREGDIYQELWIKGSTLDGGLSASVKMLIAVCGDRFTYTGVALPSLATRMTAPDTVNTKTISVLDLFSFETPSAVFPTEACLKEFTLCNEAGLCGLEGGYTDAFTIDGLDLQVNIAQPQAPLSIQVGVKQPDQTFFTLPLSIEICGYETILPVVEGSQYYNQDDLQSALVADDAIYVELEPLFTNDSPDNYCPIVSYSLVQGPGSTDPVDSSYFQWLTINDTHFSINEYAPFMNFAIMASTANGQQGWKEYTVSFDQCGTQTILPYAPEYEIKVTKNIGQDVLILDEALIFANLYTGLAGVCPIERYEFKYPSKMVILPFAYQLDTSYNIYINSTLLADVFEFSFSALEVTAFTEELRTGSFDVIVKVGCFFESTIGLNFPSYSSEYDWVLAVQQADPADPNTFFHSEEIAYHRFITEIPSCYASKIILCLDSNCQTQINTDSLKFSTNPTVKTDLGFPVAQLHIDRRETAMYQDVFIMGQTLDPLVNVTIKAKIAVCGQQFAFAALDS